MAVWPKNVITQILQSLYNFISTLDAKIQDCGGQNILLAGNAGGNIKMYDVRMPIQAVNIGSREMSLGHNVSSIAIHPRFGVMASWAQQQQLVSIHTLDQDKGTCHLLNCVKYHEEGVLGVKLGIVKNNNLWNIKIKNFINFDKHSIALICPSIKVFLRNFTVYLK